MSIYDELMEEIENNPIEFLDDIEKLSKKIKDISVEESKSLLIDDNLKKIKKGPVVKENDIFTPLISTTVTISGQISNLDFLEKDLIKKIEPIDNILLIGCNFGEKQSKRYKSVMEAKEKTKTNRGRKKKIKHKNTNHIQGSGKYLNSQITFLMEEHNKLYQFKLFRTGSIQLPGAKLGDLNDVIKCIFKIIELLKDTLGDKNILLTSLIPSMKNYKFSIIMSGDDTTVDLNELKRVVLETKSPMIKDVKYTSEDIKLSMNFYTPTDKKKDKCMRLNVFTSGKINILGAYDDKMTISIYNFLLDLFKQKYEQIIISLSCPHDDDYVVVEYLDNIIEKNYSIDEIFADYKYEQDKNNTINNILFVATNMLLTKPH